MVNLIGATADDARDIMIEANPGFWRFARQNEERPEYRISKRRLEWPSRAWSLILPLTNQAAAQASSFTLKLWADEVRRSRRYQGAWDQAMFGLRLGDDRRGRSLFMSTPKGGNWFADLFKYASARQDGEWAAFRYVSADNPHLDAGEIETAREVQSDRLFRQEYMAEILDDVPGALWTRALLDDHRRGDLPDLKRVVIGIDPAVTATDDSDETGILVAGVDRAGEGYVFDDLSGRYSPDGWARRVSYAYHHREADRAVAEVNNGGDLVEATLRTVDKAISYKAVRATRGKYTRAEPIAALYEQGRVHHVGTFPELEDQMCTWVPGEKSPDRLDALVWALTELMLVPTGVVFG